MIKKAAEYIRDFIDVSILGLEPRSRSKCESCGDEIYEAHYCRGKKMCTKCADADLDKTMLSIKIDHQHKYSSYYLSKVDILKTELIKLLKIKQDELRYEFVGTKTVHALSSYAKDAIAKIRLDHGIPSFISIDVEFIMDSNTTNEITINIIT